MFIIVWLPIFILTILFLYPRRILRSKENYIIYKNNGLLFLVFGLVFLASLVISFFLTKFSAQTQENAYGGAAEILFWVMFIAPFLFTLGFSFVLRGVKFLVEAKEIKKMV